MGSPTDTKLTAFINPRNKGVKHIKKMDLYLADQLDKCNQVGELRMLPHSVAVNHSPTPFMQLLQSAWNAYVQSKAVMFHSLGIGFDGKGGGKV